MKQAGLKMKYKVENGLNVCQDGEVIIQNVRHRVANRFVYCNSSLNSSAWNTTEELSLCPKCYPVPIQLSFNF